MDIQLRQVKILSFYDGAIYQIPNQLFLRYAVVNASKRGQNFQTNKNLEQLVKVCIPIHYDTDPNKIRKLMKSQLPFGAKLWLTTKFEIELIKDNVSLNVCDSQRTELLLALMHLLHEENIEVRY